jgi:hypothetical protein
MKTVTEQTIEDYKTRYALGDRSITEGTILVKHYDYEMMIKTFFLVTARSGKTITLQVLATGYHGGFEQSGNWVSPMPYIEEGSEPFKKRINKDGEISFNNYTYTTVWSGEPLYSDR